MDKNQAEPSPKSPLQAWPSLLVILALVWGGTEAWSWWQDRALAQQIRQLAKPGDIVMFDSNTCVYCLKAQAWLKVHNIPWQSCNVDTTPVCQAQFQQQGAPGTPLFKVSGKWRLGFDPAWIAQTLAGVKGEKPDQTALPKRV